MAHRTIPVLVEDSPGVFDAGKRHWKLALYNEDGTPFAGGEPAEAPSGTMRYRGNYSAAVADYVEGDVVKHASGLYVAPGPIQQGQTPGINPNMWYISTPGQGNKDATPYAGGVLTGTVGYEPVKFINILSAGVVDIDRVGGTGYIIAWKKSAPIAGGSSGARDAVVVAQESNLAAGLNFAVAEGDRVAFAANGAVPSSLDLNEAETTAQWSVPSGAIWELLAT